MVRHAQPDLSYGQKCRYTKSPGMMAEIISVIGYTGAHYGPKGQPCYRYMYVRLPNGSECCISDAQLVPLRDPRTDPSQQYYPHRGADNVER